MKDKIVQIFLVKDGEFGCDEDCLFGLSESGVLYLMLSDAKGWNIFRASPEIEK